MLGICINNNESLEFEYGIGSLKDYCNERDIDVSDITDDE